MLYNVTCYFTVGWFAQSCVHFYGIGRDWLISDRINPRENIQSYGSVVFVYELHSKCVTSVISTAAIEKCKCVCTLNGLSNVSSNKLSNESSNELSNKVSNKFSNVSLFVNSSQILDLTYEPNNILNQLPVLI